MFIFRGLIIIKQKATDKNKSAAFCTFLIKNQSLFSLINRLNRIDFKFFDK